MAKLTVNQNTTVQDLQRFAQLADNNAKIRGKKNGDGSITLYTSSKGGSGLKNYLFGTTAKRQDNAKSAITGILFANTKRIGAAGDNLDTAMTHLLGDLPTNGTELRGAALKQIASSAVDAWVEAYKPSGMQVGGNGAVTGTISVSHGVSNDMQTKPLSQLFDDVTNDPMVQNMTNVGGIPLSVKAHADMVRMNFMIGDHSTMGPPGGEGTAEFTEHQNANARALRDMAGSDNATKVLSLLTNQYMLRPLERTITTEAGDRLQFDPPKGLGPFSYKDSNGNLTANMQKPGQYSEAQYSLDKYNDGSGDFKVTVRWDRYATGFRNIDTSDVTPMPMPTDGRMLKATYDLEMRISKAQADLGQLSFQLVGDPTVTFDGHLQ